MISLCLPTRNRPDNLERMLYSATSNAESDLEAVCYMDEDDAKSFKTVRDFDAFHRLRIVPITGPRLTMSDYWNKCADHASGDILMLCADDLIFRTEGWDRAVESAFETVPNSIVMIWADDGQPNAAEHATHPFLHRRWVDTVGYMTPPYFVSDYADTWINDLAAGVDRRVYLPEVCIEHMHFSLEKAEMDDTYRDRLLRHAEQNPAQLYEELLPERLRDIEKLKAVMA